LISACGFALVVSVLGCLSLKSYYRYESAYEKLPRGTRVLMEPLLASATFPHSFDKGLLSIREMIRAKLTAAGFAVLSEEQTNAALRELYPQGKNIFNPDTGKIDVAKLEARRMEYVSRLRERDACDVVLSSRVVVREATYLGTNASWDGVIRNVHFDNTHMGAGNYTMSGVGAGLSVGIRVFDLQDRTLHESFGGIDLVHRVEPSVAPNRYGLIVRENALNDRKMIAEAVAIALHPFVVYEGYPEKPVFQEE
jgi:hypothetical protein